MIAIVLRHICSHSVISLMREHLKGLNYPPCALLRCISNPLAIVSDLTHTERFLDVRTKTTERNGGKIPETRR
jgi:hypothetical protein